MSLAQLSQLLPLPDEELQQVLDYAATLSKPDAVAHFSNLLGDSPLAVDFISTFNSRRQAPAAPPAPSASASSSKSATIKPAPKSTRQPKKKKAPLHTPQARKVEGYSGLGGRAYNKKDSDLEYIPQRASAPSSNHTSRPGTPPKPSMSNEPIASNAQSTKPASLATKQNAPSSTSGYLISDPPKKTKAKSIPVSRASTPNPAGGSGNITKISISGGTPMAGQSTALADLDAAIRSLEITTNPTLEKDPKARKCNCVATKHPLQAAAPNCLSCGKVICLKEGLGPCTFCGSLLLSPEEVQAMVRELKDERGREKMAANAAANRRPDVAKTPAPFTQPRGGDDGPSLTEAAAKAREHRDKLLNFQAQNARRTTVRDEAADFDVTDAMRGTGSMWASPEERAKELKRQQKVMRELEWNARPEYEKRQQIVSIDLAGRRIVKTLAAIERPATPEDKEEDHLPEPAVLAETSGNKNGGGAFSTNPLLGAVMRPVYDAKGKGAERGGRSERKKGWSRVQNDLDNNEGIILDGGVHGHSVGVGADEPECG